MTTAYDNIQNYAQNHPLSIAAGLIIVIPGTYLYAAGKSPLLELEHAILPQTHSTPSGITNAVSLGLADTVSKLSKLDFLES